MNQNFDRNFFGRKLKQFRLSKNLTQVSLSEQTGYSQNTISNWENGNREPDSIGDLVELADFFKVNIDEFFKEQTIDEILHDIPTIDSKKTYDTYEDFVKEETSFYKETLSVVEVYQNLSCGTIIFVDDEIIDSISLPESLLNPRKKYFAQYAEGDSMLDSEIHDGDLLIFEKTQSIENGKIGCFFIDDGIATCKRFYKDDNTGVILLQAANRKYQPIVIIEDTESFVIIGKLALVIQKRDY